jgi:hypothetical protein
MYIIHILFCLMMQLILEHNCNTEFKNTIYMYMAFTKTWAPLYSTQPVTTWKVECGMWNVECGVMYKCEVRIDM